MIRLSKSVIGKEEIKAVKAVLKNEYLGMGKTVKQFEDQLSMYFNKKAICVNTGTAALHLACQAIGLKKGDEVLVQSLTFIATFQAIKATGATPVPCEINVNNFTLDLEDVRKKYNKKVKAIMPIHYSGSCGNLSDIYKFAKEKNIRVIEDAAHAFGTVYKNKLIGSFGDIICFSFDGIKNITSGEGGGVVTSDKNIIRKISDARLLGVQNDSEKRYTGKRSWEFDVTEQGWRYHMSEIMAAIGIEQLKKINKFKLKRQLLAKKYQLLFKKLTEVRILEMDYDNVVPHIFIIRVDKRIRDSLKKFLEDNGVQTGLHYKPNHLLTYFRNKKAGKLKKTESVYDEMITLPLHPDLTITQVNYIFNKIRMFLKNE